MITTKPVTTVKNTVFRKSGHEIAHPQYLQISKNNYTCGKIWKKNIQTRIGADGPDYTEANLICQITF